MNCPKCGWPGLIGGGLKKELASAQESNRIRMEDNAHLRGALSAAKSEIENLKLQIRTLKNGDAVNDPLVNDIERWRRETEAMLENRDEQTHREAAGMAWSLAESETRSCDFVTAPDSFRAALREFGLNVARRMPGGNDEEAILAIVNAVMRTNR